MPKAGKPNQHKPNPPDELCRPTIEKYWLLGCNDEYIRTKLLENIDTSRYGIGIVRFREMRERLGFKTSRKFQGTIQTLMPVMKTLRVDYPKAGIREMISHLWHEHNMRVPRSLVIEYFHTYESELCEERKVNRFKRKMFWAAGVFDVICVDQHDKWKKFGLALHHGVEPVAGPVLWMNVWWTNNNPRIVLSYYLDWVERVGYTSLVTQSDPGSENFGISNGHTALRHWHDPQMKGTLCHRWMRSKKNIKPEISWSQYRRRFAPGFEDILEWGVERGIYDAKNPIEKLVFRYLFIPWLQRELDSYVARINNFKKRHDKNKILPQGVPNLIAEHPEDFGVLDFRVGFGLIGQKSPEGLILNFQIKVEKEAITEVRREFLADQPSVFHLVPPDFDPIVSKAWADIGNAEVNRNTCWDVYQDVLAGVLNALASNHDSNLPELENIEAEWKDYFDEGDVGESIALVEDEHPLHCGPGNPRPDGSYYYGGVNHGAGLNARQEAERDQRENEVDVELPVDYAPPAHHMLIMDFSDDEDDADTIVAWA
ncbi:hypothetical protein V5O48_013733 [Marasmius crinis-equi]|uniref:Integrase core domain-containing protein n=1 Tax=Marasmius crinis-equi TaxID=585013 RepID=A0ABR3EZE4_9AGAR